MKSLAIISEYNPFHNGHAYQVQQARIKSNAEVVIAIMSGQFTQRGEPALVNKFIRAQMALSNVDLVVELPQFYAVSYADDFAYGAIMTSRLLEVAELSFGCETTDLTMFNDAITTLEQTKPRHLGDSYAKAMAPNNPLFQPNNILAMQYIRNAKLHYNTLQFVPILRTNAYHGTELLDIASATAIRKAIDDRRDFSNSVPTLTHKLLLNAHTTQWNDFFPFLKFEINRLSHAQLRTIYMMTEGLEYRIKKIINDYNDYRSFMAALKTKRYTYTRLQRLMVYILLNITNDDQHPNIEAIRVLAMNETGRQYLKSLNHTHIYTNTNKKNAHHFELEVKASQIYNTITNGVMNEFNTPVIY